MGYGSLREPGISQTIPQKQLEMFWSKENTLLQGDVEK